MGKEAIGNTEKGNIAHPLNIDSWIRKNTVVPEKDAEMKYRIRRKPREDKESREWWKPRNVKSGGADRGKHGHRTTGMRWM